MFELPHLSTTDELFVFRNLVARNLVPPLKTLPNRQTHDQSPRIPKNQTDLTSNPLQPQNIQAAHPKQAGGAARWGGGKGTTSAVSLHLRKTHESVNRRSGLFLQLGAEIKGLFSYLGPKNTSNKTPIQIIQA